MSCTPADHDARDSAGFAATRWTVVLAAAKGRDSPAAADAMAELCRDYWYPLYAFIRRRGYESHQAEDLTQEFFARLLDKDVLAGVDREKGKFRAFLLAAVKHFLANERDRAQAQKRGGGRAVIAWESLDAEARYRLEPADELTPEKLFERRWALALLDQVLSRLQGEFDEGGKTRQFDALKGALTGGLEGTYAAIAERLGMSEVAVKVAVHRLRRRYRELLREEIAHTVADPAEIDEEIRHLLDCL
ncbi:MAG: sigma-70 family RNA polymerase sigma factor [Pirellulaceae bacterium]|jgi:RNA polymerase sigma-70 factor (ECF subfamily)|nr:sigma-70 family RNA polymerase sigma factor [Pirellulaceae bacterium]